MHPESNIKRPVIEFRNVSLSFDEKAALRNVSFELRRGQMILLTGVSESGKSVLLRLAAGLLRPDEGEILIEGREIQDLDERSLLEIRARSMGIVFQDQSLFTGLSVFENAAYRLDERGWPEEQIEPAVLETLSFVGLQEDTEKLPEELSVGMRRRLEFARAMVGWPPILLLDEPTAGLDPINARMMLDLIIRARAEHGISSLYVTKEMHEIPYLAAHYASKHAEGNGLMAGTAAESGNETKLLLLDHGRIAFLGSVDEFESSDLPSVTLMTRPEPGAPITTAYIRDPWSRKRRKSAL
jgi:phospholipid/cholesterol/gamma-HCH transport system ATP-binding protein